MIPKRIFQFIVVLAILALSLASTGPPLQEERTAILTSEPGGRYLEQHRVRMRRHRGSSAGRKPRGGPYAFRG